MVKIDITGKTYGRLTVSSEVKTRKGYKRFWYCRCSCGNTLEVYMNHLRSGHTISCGCYQLDHPARYRHGAVKTKLYYVWGTMKDRCMSPANSNYPKYGAKGVTVCKAWKDFVAFQQWAKSTGYVEGLTIDRTNVYGNYEPSNCRWIPMKQQGINKRKQCNNTSGFVGVYAKGKRWHARVRIIKKDVHVGVFDCPKAASLARRQYFVDHNLQEHVSAYDLQQKNN